MSARTTTLAASMALIALTQGLATAQAPMLKDEPPPGELRAGERVLVDDGTCPKGQINEVIGGGNIDRRSKSRAPGAPRERRCIPTN